jgi:hypothetical protein
MRCFVRTSCYGKARAAMLPNNKRVLGRQAANRSNPPAAVRCPNELPPEPLASSQPGTHRVCLEPFVHRQPCSPPRSREHIAFALSLLCTDSRARRLSQLGTHRVCLEPFAHRQPCSAVESAGNTYRIPQRDVHNGTLLQREQQTPVSNTRVQARVSQTYTVAPRCNVSTKHRRSIHSTSITAVQA